jgi:hypothetical protein
MRARRTTKQEHVDCRHGFENALEINKQVKPSLSFRSRSHIVSPFNNHQDGLQDILMYTLLSL